MKKLLILILTLTVLTGETRELDGNEFKTWEWQQTSCPNCEIEILPIHPMVLGKPVLRFIKALEDHKSELVELYGIDGQEYNLLAHMAVGILGQESEFFQGTTYQMKERVPWLVSFIKVVRGIWTGKSAGANSRGPTQIKIVPKKIAEAYRITPEQLWIPENAALATVGFLIEALRELKTRLVVNKLDFINTGNYVNYLPYIYFGSTYKLLNVNNPEVTDSKKKAIPDENLYIRNMKKYMGWFLIRERPF